MVELSNLNIKNGLCISLGANIDSKFGSPFETLIKCKEDLSRTITNWINNINETETKTNNENTNFTWSSIYKTKPHGIIETQPYYFNSLLLVESNLFPLPTYKNGILLLDKLKNIEFNYGREINIKTNKWLPRCLDLDILWWENLTVNTDKLILPHPRLFTRNFVITPLSEILSQSQEIEKFI